MNSAAKMRLCRERQKNGLVVYKIVVPELATIETLVAIGVLDRANSDNRDAVEAALSSVIVDWTEAFMDLDL